MVFEWYGLLKTVRHVPITFKIAASREHSLPMKENTFEIFLSETAFSIKMKLYNNRVSMVLFGIVFGMFPSHSKLLEGKID